MAKDFDCIDIGELRLDISEDVLCANIILDDNIKWYLDKLDLAYAQGERLGNLAEEKEFKEVRDKLLALQSFYLPEQTKYGSNLNEINYAVEGITTALAEIGSS